MTCNLCLFVSFLKNLEHFHNISNDVFGSLAFYVENDKYKIFSHFMHFKVIFTHLSHFFSSFSSHFIFYLVNKYTNNVKHKIDRRDGVRAGMIYDQRI